MFSLGYLLLVGSFVGVALIVRFVISKDIREYPE